MDEKYELSKLLSGDSPDPKQVGQVYRNIFEYEAQIIEATVEIRNALRELLTEEQRSKMDMHKSGKSKSGECQTTEDSHHKKQDSESQE